MMSSGASSNPQHPREHLPDPRSRHHPQYRLNNQRRAQQEELHDHGNHQQRNQYPVQYPHALQHHPSHPDHRRYIEALQTNGLSSHHHIPTSPQQQHPPLQQQQYQAYNPNQRLNHANKQGQPLRRVASVERGLGLPPKNKSHRMSRMKSFGDRDRERNRGEEAGMFPPRKSSQSGIVVTGMLLTPGSGEGGYSGNLQRIDSGDKYIPLQSPTGENKPQPKKYGDLSQRAVGSPSTPSPTSSRPGSSRSGREMGGAPRSNQVPTEVGMERTGGVRDVNNRYEGVPGTPGLRMPIAFSSLARDRGFSTSSQQTPAAYHNHHLYFPTPRPSNSAPNLANAETNSRSHHGYGPDSYYAQRRQNHYNVSQPQSTHQSPHNSILQEEVRRSALIVDRDSTISSSAASSNAMTVDEAIGMYGSDTDNDDYGDTARVEEEVSKFHSFNSVDTQQPLSPIYDNTNNLSNQHPSQLPPPSSRGAPSPPPTGPLPLTPVEVKPIPPPVGVSEVLVDDVVLSQEEPVVDDILPPPPSSLSDTPPTPPQSPPVVPQNPMEVYGEPYRLPPSISSQVPPKLPYVQGPLISDPVKDARDRYGFRKQTQYVTLAEYETWNVEYEETLSRRKTKWEQLMKESGLAYEDGPVRFPPPSAKIKRFVRKGIPPEWRGAAWFWYAGGPAKMQKNPGVYQKLLKEQSSSPDCELIERDLHRTFPDNIFFKPESSMPNNQPHQKKPSRVPETPIIQALRRVLVAFSIYVPKVGYCQSLNFLAGLLLLFMDEEKAFWMLYIITQQHLPGTHEVNLEGSTADQGVLMMSVRESLPGVWVKIAGGLDGSAQAISDTPRDLPPITLCTTPWFMSGFLGTLPIESVLRVWDSWFYEGSKILFRIALTIFKIGEQQIRSLSDSMEVFQVVQNIPRRLIDAGALLEQCFRRRNGIGHLSQEDVDQRRLDRRTAYARERARAMTPGSGVRQSKDDGSMRKELHEHDLRARFARKMKMRI